MRRASARSLLPLLRLRTIQRVSSNARPPIYYLPTTFHASRMLSCRTVSTIVGRQRARESSHRAHALYTECGIRRLSSTPRGVSHVLLSRSLWLPLDAVL